MNITPLEVKTSYSILNSLNDIKKLVSLAKDYGYTHLAITENNNMFGVMEFYQECKKNDIEPIIGIELTIDNKHIILYAKNNSGYKNIIKLSTIVSDRTLTTDDLKTYKDNLILVMPFSFYDENIYNIYDDKFIGYKTIEERNMINEKYVFINDVSYLYKDDYVYLDYANMIKDGKIIGEYELNTHIGKHLLTQKEMTDLNDDKSIKNNQYITDNCHVTLSYTECLLTIYDKNIDRKKHLSELSHKYLFCSVIDLSNPSI